MKQLWILLLHLILTMNAWAGDVVDLYGASPSASDRIIKHFVRQVREIESELTAEFASSMDGNIRNPKRVEQLLQKKARLVNAIKRTGHFLFADLQTVSYPGDNDIYTTIEVVEKNQPERLQYVHPKHPIKSVAHDDLINTMIVYQSIAMKLMMTGQLDLHDNSCPVYHCTVPFKHPKLKPYLALFNEGAVHQKQEIIQALNHDPDPERRAAAAFLIGHFNNPQDIMSLLSPHVNDEDEGVRNNVLRVMGETVARAHITTFDATPFLSLLDSPSVTDRNKSLLVLLTAADSSAGKKQIIQQGQARFIALLRLKQPNNHGMAYAILKKISGRDFSETDFTAWEQWFIEAQTGNSRV